jgi:hypothetical protein
MGTGVPIPDGFTVGAGDPGPALDQQSLSTPKGAIMGGIPLEEPVKPGISIPEGFTPGTVFGRPRAFNDWLTDKASDLYDWYHGQRQFDLPELTSVINQQALTKGAPGAKWPDGTEDTGWNDPHRRVARAIMFAPGDPEAHVSAIRANFPNARFSKDEFRNLIVNIDGQRYYTNPSGLSQTDLQSAVAQGVVFGPVVKGAGIAGKALMGVVGRLGLTGAGFGVTDAGSQILSHEAGSTAPLRLGDVGSATALGVGLEGSLGVIGKGVGILTSMLRQPKYFDAMTGSWTPVGRSAMTSIGIDPDSVSPALAMRFASLARGTRSSEGAARQAVATDLPTSVPLTTGQATQDIDAVRLESAARAGSLSRQAQDVAQGQLARQSAALHGNIGDIQDVIAGGDKTVEKRGQGAQLAQQELIGQSDALGRHIDEAYGAARDASREGYAIPAYPPESVTTLKAHMAPILRDYDEQDFPAAYKAVADLDALTKGGKVPATVEELETWRRQRVNAAQANPSQAGAIKKIISVYDAELESALKDDLMSGDPSVISKWQHARALRREYGRLFGENDVVKELTSIKNDGSAGLVVDPPDAVNYIFGRGTIGATNGLRSNLLKLKSVLGEGSDGWKAIREEGWLRLAGHQDPMKPFNAALYNKNLSRALIDNPEAMNTLYTPQEQGLFKRFGKVADWATRAPSVGTTVNPSGTAAMVAKLANGFGPIGNIAKGWVMKLARPEGVGTAQGAKAIRSLTGELPAREAPGIPTSAPFAGAASQPPPASDILEYTPGFPGR